MLIVKTTPKKSLNKAFLKQRPLRSNVNTFKANLIRLLDKIDEIEREENQKNHIRDFLRDTYYKDTNEINTKDYKDLVIHLGKSNKDKVGVIIEAKRPGNKAEMITAEKPNVKALQELVLYYLRERIEEENIDIKYLIATNVYEWYIFDASYFEKYFYKNKNFVRQYEQWRDGQKVTGDTNLFYEDIAKPYIDKIADEIPCTYFDVRDYNKILHNKSEEDDKSLIALYKLLSPGFLLKAPFANDSNSLNEKFYKELLHIIGLEEVKEGSKNIIRRKDKQREPGSFIENAINILLTDDSLNNLPDRSIFGKNKEEQLFSVALELSLTWMNRILFLKLLEGQLITYHKGNSEYRFLNIGTINDFDELYKLFHQVLARNIHDRTEAVKQKYARVPYLNSSLFEISELESKTIKINSLDNSETISLIGTTILKEEKKRSAVLPALEYLFKFLDSYDFASEGGEDITEDNKTIINASVLGKVFEKINGYKDGSIFTPGFITMYMSRQALRMAVVQKFNDVFKTRGIAEAASFDELYNRVEKITIPEANEIINSLKICDPAVGSGHFLVSALNELIVIKSELGILVDKNGKRLKDYELIVDNDELIISDENGIFEYNFNNKESQRVQETIFAERQSIIENCLFGVDINPNSVKICRLRLWIELLKSSYYKAPGFTELETLPNIDINIKCGNSLISRYALDADLKKALQKSKWNINAYRIAVQSYRNTKSKDDKHEIEKLIDDIKNSFETEIQLNDKRFRKLRDLQEELMGVTTQGSLFERTKKEQADWNKKVTSLTEAIKKQEEIIENIRNNAIYKNAFEWRFEFPEVLNNNGDFEGFDVVIGNPPYIGIEDIEWDYRRYYESIYKTAVGRFDIYSLFIERGLQTKKPIGFLGYIIPAKFINNKYSVVARKMLCAQHCINVIIIDAKVFDKAQVNSTIIEAYNSGGPGNIYRAHEMIDSLVYPISASSIQSILDDKQSIFRLKINTSYDSLINKIERGTFKIREIAEVKDGIVAGVVKDILYLPKKINGFCEPLYFGKHLSRYHITETNTFVDYQPTKMMDEEIKRKSGKRPGLWMRDKNIFKRNKILTRFVAKEIIATFDDQNRYYEHTLHGTTIFDKRFNPKFVVGILNSKLINFYYKRTNSDGGNIFPQVRISSLENLPIKLANEELQKTFEKLVVDIMLYKSKGHDTTDLENQIDTLVYKLYDITPEEQKIIEGKE